MTPRKASPVAASMASGMATLEREVKMYLGLPPYAHDQNTAKGNAGYLDELNARYGTTVVMTTAGRLQKEYMKAVRAGGDVIGAAVYQHKEQPPMTTNGMRIVQVAANDVAVQLRVNGQDITIGRAETRKDALIMAMDFADKLFRLLQGAQ